MSDMNIDKILEKQDEKERSQALSEYLDDVYWLLANLLDDKTIASMLREMDRYNDLETAADTVFFASEDFAEEYEFNDEIKE